MKSRTLHVSMTGHPNNGLSILGQWAGQPDPRVQDVGQKYRVYMEETSSFSSLRMVRNRAHSLPGGNFQYPHIAGIITALLEDQIIVPASFLMLVDTTNTLALAPGTTFQVSTQ